ncbi:hypothetical protein M409DRAFT_37754 [Zasmidium cellare ATCC 36951]|uniref:Enoyl reductase (ER) domain-containing protein n=1 Tax=Zasmidium cellare ATCC 36951 TaxID=1080233 RepID=A0A6A6BZW6_ZASCE|nr:uncharacterized protein M409DRAFT_37754 [Zasmidium cellare ATCC 36951]KAF2160347.1 hypothetical protein M409DRAFT_37754 [Zasmidium cellare ATCC 36951]
MSTNKAAWLPTPKARPLTLKESPIGNPSPNQILIKTHALAIQPIDGLLQTYAFLPLQYPTILGVDVAGEVIEVGDAVSRLKKGDRVIGTAGGMLNGITAEGGFQEYVVLGENVASRIPDAMGFEQAVVLPCGLSCAASAFFKEEPYLGLRLPGHGAHAGEKETVLVWGGASSVGSNAIQLAVAAGYEVVVTASERNFAYVKSLGASGVVDYKAASAVEDVARMLKGKKVVGALDCIGGEATEMTAKAMEDVDGVRKVITSKPPNEATIEGVEVHFVDGAHFGQSDVAEKIYGGFLFDALNSGSYLAAPEPLVVGKGLESVQEGVDVVMKGMSARKAVVLL